MLNFLRKLRRSNTKAGYIKYALGEIILVVIGILIAVNINNWNESRKEKIREKQLLEKLKKENDNNLASLINDSSYHYHADMIPYTIHKTLSKKRSAKNDSIIQENLINNNRSVIYTFSSKYLERYIDNSDLQSDQLIDELVELKDSQNNLNQISQMAFDYKFEKILPLLEENVDPYTGEVLNMEALRNILMINRMVTLDNLVETQVGIYSDCIEQHLKLDSILTARLTE